MLERLTVDAAPLTVFDTHAGAGVYDMAGEAAQRSGEAAQGVLRLMQADDAPEAFAPLIQAVRRLNGGEAVRLYPGSPWLAAHALRPADTYIGCELRPDDHAALRHALAGGDARARLTIQQGDGYDLARAELMRTRGRVLLVIDPPFERADDYARTAALIAGRPARQPALIWTPLKDLETFDAFLGALEATRPASLVAAQVRLRPLDDPMRMNGCAVVLVDAPPVDDAARAACGWIAGRLGGPGAAARLDRLIGPATGG